MMGELHEVDPVAFAEVCVDFFATFQVEKTHREVVASGHQVLSVV
jgi:hypothetical protein